MMRLLCLLSGPEMRTAFTFLMLVAVTTSQAQIEIGPSDMPVRGDTLRYRASTGTGIDLALTGENVVWDFSGMSIGAEGADTLLSLSSFSQLYQISFNNNLLFPQHSANYGVLGNGFGIPIPIPGFQIQDAYDFYKITNSGFRNVGLGVNVSNFPLTSRRIPVDVIHRFPMRFGNVDTSLSSFNIAVPSLLYFGQDQVRASVVDGYGTLILPGNTFEVLRQRSVLTRRDTIFVEQVGFGFRFPEPETVEYRWVAKGMKAPVLFVTTVGGAITSVRFFYDPPAPPAPTGPPLVIFPNPATDGISVQVPEGYDGEFIFIDASGREVRPPVTAMPGTLQTFRLDNFATGAYTLQLVGGPIAWSSRFVVSE
jgi:hypothetical protein